MAISVVMPALELTQETGKVVAWRKKEGERVAKGEVLLEVETDKAVVEIEAQGDGVIAGIRAKVGAVIPVGQTIAWIVSPGELVPTDAAPNPAAASRTLTTDRAAAAAVSVAASSPAQGIRISPKARRLAREHGVDLSRVRGSGAEGEILAADILGAAESKSPDAPVAAAAEPLSSVGRLMAERTTKSWTTVPHFFVAREIDAGPLREAREKMGASIEKSHGVRPTLTDYLVALVGRVLVQHPEVNASWTGEGIRHNAAVNIGVAMAVKDGVIAAVIPKAAKSGLGEIAVQRRDLTARARAGRLLPSDISGATFTISNLGMYEVDAFTAIIVPPQAAILAVGRIAERVVAVNREAAIRPMMTMTLSCDHRVVDGARAAAFLNDLAEALREPEKRLS
ncbi:MAG: dihydrolipoamide acetyltransferase family protein [Candidatus Acidiferrales bacterium]